MTSKMTCSYTVASANNEGTDTCFFEKFVSMDSRKMAEIGMYFSVVEFANSRGRVVLDFNVDSHLIDSFILLDSEGFFSGFISLEVRRLIHVKPKSWEFNLIIESMEL